VTVEEGRETLTHRRINTKLTWEDLWSKCRTSYSEREEGTSDQRLRSIIVIFEGVMVDTQEAQRREGEER
jgi:hypothetical protein